jgi:ABC-type antimicrobial peptide transport system permease subunit
MIVVVVNVTDHYLTEIVAVYVLAGVEPIVVSVFVVLLLGDEKGLIVFVRIVAVGEMDIVIDKDSQYYKCYTYYYPQNFYYYFSQNLFLKLIFLNLKLLRLVFLLKNSVIVFVKFVVFDIVGLMVIDK